MNEYDLIIVGAGSGNMFPDKEFEQLKVAIVESTRFGGTCLNRGCIPSKMLTYTAELAHDFSRAELFDLDAELHGVDWHELKKRIFDRIDPLHDSAVSYRQDNGVDVYLGRARFTGHKTLNVNDQEIRGSQIVLANGSRPSVPDWPGKDAVRIYTSDDIMRIASLPRSMIIVGGGYITAEMAHVFSSLGTEVTVISRSSLLLAHRDRAIAERFTDIARRRYRVHLSTEIDHLQSESAEDGRVHVALTSLEHGPFEITADVLLAATGRRPNGDLLDLENTGVSSRADGSIVRDEFGATDVDGIWTFGDVSNAYQLKHMANAESHVIWHNVLHPENKRHFEFKVVPSAVFSDPQIASVGETEEELIERSAEYKCAYQSYGATAYGWALQDTTSFVKVLIDPNSRLILGAHIIGPQAAILIQPLVQAMALDNTVEDLLRHVIYTHPALTEVVEQALLKL